MPFNNFTKQNDNLIDRPDFVNRGGVIHNNLGDKLLAEHVSEYKIHIASSDRNTDSHRSPFAMKVYFGSGLKDPSISRKFKNIKYISIDSIVLPRTIAIDVSNVNINGNIYPCESAYSSIARNSVSSLTTLKNHKFIVVKINELSSNKNLGTSNLLDSDTFAFVPDYCMGSDNVMWKPMHNNRNIYPNSILHNISSLTITVYDEYGNVLSLVDHNGNKIIGKNISGINFDYIDYVSNESDNTSVAYTDNVTQVIYNFTFGVIENELNTQTNY
jgi:hypothetical protein